MKKQKSYLESINKYYEKMCFCFRQLFKINIKLVEFYHNIFYAFLCSVDFYEKDEILEYIINKKIVR